MALINIPTGWVFAGYVKSTSTTLEGSTLIANNVQNVWEPRPGTAYNFKKHSRGITGFGNDLPALETGKFYWLNVTTAFDTEDFTLVAVGDPTQSVPSAPSGITYSLGENDTGLLSWAGVVGADTYEIEGRLTSGDVFALVGPPTANADLEVYAPDYPVGAQFRVRGVNEAGAGAWSAIYTVPESIDPDALSHLLLTAFSGITEVTAMNAGDTVDLIVEGVRYSGVTETVTASTTFAQTAGTVGTFSGTSPKQFTAAAGSSGSVTIRAQYGGKEVSIPLAVNAVQTDGGKVLLIAEGDSNTQTSHSGNWADYFNTTYLTTETRAGYKNAAQGGDTSNHVITQVQTTVIDYAATITPKDQTIAILAIGVNDYGAGITAAQSVKNIFDWCVMTRQAGMKPIIVSPSPDGNSVNYKPNNTHAKQVQREIVTRELKAHWEQYGAMAYVDTTDDPEIGTFDAPIWGNGIYFQGDKLHYLAAGGTKIAQKIKPFFDTVYATPWTAFDTPPVYSYTQKVTLTATVQHGTAYQANDGIVTLSATAGTAPYEYRKGTGTWQSSNVFSGLAAEKTTFSVRDASNIEHTIPVNISEKSTTGQNAAIDPHPFQYMNIYEPRDVFMVDGRILGPLKQEMPASYSGDFKSDMKLGVTADPVVGALEFKVRLLTGNNVIGLTDVNSTRTFDSLKVAYAVFGAQARIYGTFPGNTETAGLNFTVAVNDILKIVLYQDYAVWYQNGIERGRHPTYALAITSLKTVALFVDAGLDDKAAFADVRISGANLIPTDASFTPRDPIYNLPTEATTPGSYVEENVVFTSLVGTTATDNNLEATDTATVANVGAISTKKLGTTTEQLKGRVKFRVGQNTAPVVNPVLYAGIGRINKNQLSTDLRYSWYVNGTNATPSGEALTHMAITPSSTPHVVTDVLEIEVQEDKVHWRKNGTIIYTLVIWSDTANLLFDCSIYRGKLENVIIGATNLI